MFEDVFDDIFTDEVNMIVARLLMVLVILVGTWLARKLVMAIVARLLEMAASRNQMEWDDRLILIIAPPLRFVVNVAGLRLAVLVLELPDRLNVVIEHVMESLVVIAIFWAVYRGVDFIIELLWGLGQRTMVDTPVRELLDEKLVGIAAQLLRALVIIFAIATVMETWGYDVNGVVAGLGIGGLAFALAAQDTLENLIGYFVILADEPFVVGEYIVVGDVSGTVETLGFRSTRIRVLDQSLATVPNKTIMNANVTNWSRLNKRRLNMTLGIEYGSSPTQMLAVVQRVREMLQNHPEVQSDSVITQFVAFAESSLDIMIICFMETPGWADFQAAKQDINLRIMDILEQHGVGLAFPSRTLYVQQLDDEPAIAPGVEPVYMAPEPEPAEAAKDSPVPDDAANE